MLEMHEGIVSYKKWKWRRIPKVWYFLDELKVLLHNKPHG